MVIVRLCFIAFLLLLIVSENRAFTHWWVTDSGRIQAYSDSPFDLRRPYDLLALLDQETRITDINSLYTDLKSRKTSIEKKWSGLEDVENIGAQVPNCAEKAVSGLLLPTNFAFNGTDRVGLTMNILNKRYDDIKIFNAPDCIKHGTDSTPQDKLLLENPSNIMLKANKYLKQYMPGSSVKVFGHELTIELNKNCTSWFHYNLASLFWRIKGDGTKAMNCIKRAIQYVPREYRDIPLHNLGAILHQAEHYEEAAIFLHSALDHAPNEAMHYYALGTVYAEMGENNKSGTYFNKYLEMKPEQKNNVMANEHMLLCILKVEKGLMTFQESLENILSELHDYHSQQQQWLRLLERLMWEQSSFDLQFDGSFQLESPDLLNQKRIQRCVQKTSENSKQVISCNFYNHVPDLDTLNLQSMFNYVETEKQKLLENFGKVSGTAADVMEKKDSKKRKPIPSTDELRNVRNIKTPPVVHPKYPTSLTTSGNQYFDATGWPSKDECLSWNLPVDQKEDLDLPVFLPPENKGFQIKRILSDYINLPDGSQHELPWYPPVCEHHNVFGDKYVPSNERQALNNELKSNDFLRNHLLQYVNEGKADEAEIGQRIITAMEKKSAPQWVLATLASLYWRVRGNARRALDCLDLAFQIVPKDPTDVVLVSIGSVVYQLGFIDQAVKFATLAFKINYVEPSTNFLLALIHYSNNNPLLAMYYMKNVLRIEPDYYNGKAELLLKTWGCRIKLGGYSGPKQSNERPVVDGMCAKKESFKGEGVICSPNGDHCKTAAIQCYQTNLPDGENAIDSNAKDKTAPCNVKNKLGLGQSLISSLLEAEGGSGDTEPDQSKLETVTDSPTGISVRLSLGAEHPINEHTRLGDFYVSISVSDNPEAETLLYVYDKFGAYSLSPTACRNLKVIHPFKYATVWPSIVARSLDLIPYLKPLPKSFDGPLKPFCEEVPASTFTLEHLTAMMLRHRLPSSPEKDLIELVQLMTSDHKSTEQELAAKLSLALSENSTSWILGTAAAMYWRIVGNSEQAVTCFRLALANAPSEMRDIPLMHLSNLLNRVGFHADALEVAQTALKIHSNFVLNHFAVGNIYIAMGELEKAVAYYRACLALDSNFEPARRRLYVVLCAILFDDSASQKPADDTPVN